MEDEDGMPARVLVGTESFEWSDLDGLMGEGSVESPSDGVSLKPRRLSPGRSSRVARLAAAEAVIAVKDDDGAIGKCRREGGTFVLASRRGVVSAGLENVRLGSGRVAMGASSLDRCASEEVRLAEFELDFKCPNSEIPARERSGMLAVLGMTFIDPAIA